MKKILNLKDFIKEQEEIKGKDTRINILDETILLFDTETLGVVKPYIYDIGYHIIKDGEVVARKSYLVSEIYDDLGLFNTAYYKDKRPKYEEDIASGKITVKNWLAITREMWVDMEKYGVTVLSAYNLAFDVRALKMTNELLYPDKKISFHLLQDKKLVDLWLNSANTLFNSRTFRSFIDKHNFYTEKGNRQGSAEIAYRYIKNSPEFIEEHRAIQDVEIETEILFAIIVKNPYVMTGLQGGIWRLYNEDILNSKGLK